jgi:hypothetical protein
LVFAGDVATIIFIAEKRPAARRDKIRLGVADERCAKFTGLDREHIAFDLSKSAVAEVPYEDAFTPDGRILTRISPRRKAILDRFKGQTLEDAAQTFWLGKRGSTIEAWSLERPDDDRDLRWEQTDMIRMGTAFRGSVHEAKSGGRDVFKGENIVACRLEGEPVNRNIDVARMDDSSLWQFSDILPDQGFAFHRISPALTCAPFGPKTHVLLNTATLFFPKQGLAGFPFDFLVVSRLYQYYFALSQREGVLFRGRCNVYTRTIRRLPWTDRLAEQQRRLVELRAEFLTACENLHQREDVLLQKLEEAPHTTLREVVAAAELARVEWSAELRAGRPVRIGRPRLYERDGWFVVHPGDDLLHWIGVKDRAIAECFVEGLALQAEEALTHKAMMEIPLPTPEALDRWRKTVADFDRTNYEKSLEGTLDKLDGIVARAFRIPAEEVGFIKTDLQTDPMLRRVKPNLPFTGRRLVGLRKGLAASDRYAKAYKTRR